MLDSGTSDTIVPLNVSNSIYSGVQGAEFDNSSGMWLCPCNAEINVTVVFGGQSYPIHPLDTSCECFCSGHWVADHQKFMPYISDYNFATFADGSPACSGAVSLIVRPLSRNIF
jgi:hypothetical protein